ncbi:hypothetical protein P8452_73832 [Trifolium repens]|nr:hypothetical protein P8452_73832 [Trifolium repens]
MPIAINQDINTFFGSRRRICHMQTVHVKHVPYGEIDPYFAHKYVDELDDELKLYSCGYLHLCSWNRDLEQPRITIGWTEIRDHFELPFQFHLIELVYYGDSMFHLMPCLTKELSTMEFPVFHTLSTKSPDPFSFEIVLANTGCNDRQLILNNMVAEKICKYHSNLLLEGPVVEPMMCPIVTNGRKTEILGWQNFCNENGFYDGDIVKFTCFDIENSWRVDVDRVTS